MRCKRFMAVITILIFFFALDLLGVNINIAAAEKNVGNCCSAVTIEAAAAILSVPVEDLLTSNSEVLISPEDLQRKIYKIHPYACRFRSRTNFLKSITYFTYVFNDPARARREFNRMCGNFKTVSKVDVVPDLGDEACWAGDKRFRRLVAIKGGVIIDVLSPKDFKLQKRIMDLVLQKF